MKMRGLWRTLTRIIFALTAAFVICGCETSTSDSHSARQNVSGTVSMTIDFDGRSPSRNFQASCESTSTVFSVLRQLESDGELSLAFSGSGATVLVTSIDGLENERAAGDNWTYRVNGNLADRSCGVFQVQSGDHILWQFGDYP